MKERTIYALGFFDGVHLGHQALLAACRALADTTGALAGVVTFTAHPEALVSGAAPALINTPADRKMLLQHHMDTVLELPFDRAMMAMPWQDFFRLLRETYGAAGLVCGEDFRFGSRGEGDSEKLRTACAQAGIPCVVVPQQRLDDVVISSTYIRMLLAEGRMAEAVRFLGHPHILTGQVIHGRQLGRTIGIPTANLALPEGVAELRHGVYACRVFIEGREYMAVTNVGMRPTVDGKHVTVEPWILDFDGDLYGKTLTLHFYEFLRPEQKFDSLETLQAEIQKNAAQTRKIFEKS
jgi:riboflavin kinase/FMN adenylyltransferase